MIRGRVILVIWSPTPHPVLPEYPALLSRSSPGGQQPARGTSGLIDPPTFPCLPEHILQLQAQMTSLSFHLMPSNSSSNSFYLITTSLLTEGSKPEDCREMNMRVTLAISIFRKLQPIPLDQNLDLFKKMIWIITSSFKFWRHSVILLLAF